MEICLNAHEEYLKEMDNEELNEDYRQYLKKNNNLAQDNYVNILNSVFFRILMR